ncbi:Rho guanine nucleotide exchange factor [Paragonimus westermani]|uniref:Rho guanine nucleotide exchange factor n=1 Tax=Paragonimus westermani TaxID=34504 RepID=A0A8T0DC84_9TREM|nr:Rho guanine nucleotide exchange factor [Paragonimus westermani]
MFTDQIVFTVAKRRGSQVLKKPMLLRLQSPKGVDTIENIKYKIFHRLGIEAIEFEQCTESESDRLVQHRELRDKKDLALLAEIDNISSKLDYRHHDLDIIVRQLYQSVQQELEGLRTARNTLTSIPKNLSVFTATTKEGIERYELMFPTSEKRQDWERTVIELKRQLSSVKRTSKFNDALEIPRTLPGIQLSCAAVVEVAQLTKTTPRDVWICAADGYTGYLCLLTLHPKPMIALNIPLAGCNSRITCICAVPGCPNPTPRRVSGSHGIGSNHPRLVMDDVRSNRQRILKSKSEEPESIAVGDSDTVIITDKVFPLKKLASEAMTRSFVDVNDSSTESIRIAQPYIGHTEDKTVPLSLSSSMIVNVQKQMESDDVIPQETEKSSKEELGKSPTNVPTFGIDEEATKFLAELISDEAENRGSENTDSSDASEAEHDVQEESTTNHITPGASKSNTSSGDQTSDQSEQTRNVKSFRLMDPFRSTMWLGTEEGSIFIFYATDNIKTSRRRQRITLSSAINSILHLDVRIFIACINGDFLVYDRNSDGLWDVDAPRLLNIQPDCEDPVIVRRMLAVAGNVWCAAHRFIYVLNSVTLKVEVSLCFAQPK